MYTIVYRSYKMFQHSRQ